MVLYTLALSETTSLESQVLWPRSLVPFASQTGEKLKYGKTRRLKPYIHTYTRVHHTPIYIHARRPIKQECCRLQSVGRNKGFLFFLLRDNTETNRCPRAHEATILPVCTSLFFPSPCREACTGRRKSSAPSHFLISERTRTLHILATKERRRFALFLFVSPPCHGRSLL